MSNIHENVQSVVPFFLVSDMERSADFYIRQLGFRQKHEWVVDGKLRWCWLTLGGAALMLQEDRQHTAKPALPKKGGGRVSVLHLPGRCGDLPRVLLKRRGCIRAPGGKRDVGHFAPRSRRVPVELRKPHRCARGDNLEPMGAKRTVLVTSRKPFQ